MVIKTATLHKTLCVVVWRHKNVLNVPRGNSEGNLFLYDDLYQSVMQSISFIVLYQTFPLAGSSGCRNDIYKTDFDFKT